MADSPRWCAACKMWGDHHSDRCSRTPSPQDEQPEYAIGYRAGYELAARIDVPNWLVDNGYPDAASALASKLDGLPPLGDDGERS